MQVLRQSATATRSHRRRGHRWTALAFAVPATLGLIGVSPSSAAEYGAPTPINVNVSGANGEGRIETPGRTCAEGGQGAYWNYDYGAQLPAGVFSSLPGDVRMHLALHSDVIRFPNTGPVLPMTPAAAFLIGDDSHASVANDRGTIKVRLTSGTCNTPTLAFNGITTAGSGTWSVDSGQGSYRQATGSGTFTVQADVAPGADNPFSLQLAGTVQVLQPNLKVEVIGTFWGSLGTDYLTRRVSVVYRITNVGVGDAFGASITNITSQPGAQPMANPPILLGDIPAGESRTFSTRHQLQLLGPPCFLVILGCNFQTTMTVNLPDALDQPHVLSDTVAAKAPLLPPPL